MIKKIVGIICLILIVGILYTVKNTHQTPHPKQTTLQFASWGSESEISILKPILSDFEKENPNIKDGLIIYYANGLDDSSILGLE